MRLMTPGDMLLTAAQMAAQEAGFFKPIPQLQFNHIDTGSALGIICTGRTSTSYPSPVDSGQSILSYPKDDESMSSGLSFKNFNDNYHQSDTHISSVSYSGSPRENSQSPSISGQSSSMDVDSSEGNSDQTRIYEPIQFTDTQIMLLKKLVIKKKLIAQFIAMPYPSSVYRQKQSSATLGFFDARSLCDKDDINAMEALLSMKHGSVSYDNQSKSFRQNDNDKLVLGGLVTAAPSYPFTLPNGLKNKNGKPGKKQKGNKRMDIEDELYEVKRLNDALNHQLRAAQHKADEQMRLYIAYEKAATQREKMLESQLAVLKDSLEGLTERLRGPAVTCTFEGCGSTWPTTSDLETHMKECHEDQSVYAGSKRSASEMGILDAPVYKRRVQAHEWDN